MLKPKNIIFVTNSKRSGYYENETVTCRAIFIAVFDQFSFNTIFQAIIAQLNAFRNTGAGRKTRERCDFEYLKLLKELPKCERCFPVERNNE